MRGETTMPIRRFALLLLFVPLVAHAQVTLDKVTEGTMLLKSAQPGVYVAAPTVATEVKLQVRGLILRGEVTQRFRNPESTCAERSSPSPCRRPPRSTACA